MKSTRTHGAAAATTELTEQDWAELDAKYRARYPRECADYRKKFGVEPSLGTLIAAETRRECNHWTDEEREEIHARGMEYYRSLIANKPHAHAIRG